MVCPITRIRRMLGQYQPLSTYHLPSAPILTVPIPNLPVSVAEKAVKSLSSPPPFGGNERCILSFFPRESIFSALAQLLPCEDDYLERESAAPFQRVLYVTYLYLYIL
ncbi:hypothetical protein MTP99_017107 [Tenebrio molitor]|nr:hypothetical protein MTP99_017107 [Tenebrio molitor]